MSQLRDFNHIYITATALTSSRINGATEACMDDREARNFLNHAAISQVEVERFVLFGPSDDPSVMVGFPGDLYAIMRPSRSGPIAWSMIGIFPDERAQVAYLDPYMKYKQKQFSKRAAWTYDPNKLFVREEFPKPTTKATTPMERITAFVTALNQLDDTDAAFQLGKSTNAVTITMNWSANGSVPEILDQLEPLVDAFKCLGGVDG